MWPAGVSSGIPTIRISTPSAGHWRAGLLVPALGLENVFAQNNGGDDVMLVP